MRELGLSAEVRFAAYNQVFQELLDPGGLLARNISGVNVVLVRFEHWPAGQAAGFVDAVRAAAGRMAVPLIVVLCPGAAQCDDEVRHGVAGLPSVYLLTAARIAALYPVAEVHDPAGDQLGRVPYTPLYFVALATALARQIHAIHAPPFKAIALDCDDTLWAAICGEDGPEGGVLPPPRRALQEFMAERRREGMLLALCSKNNEEDVAATFRAHPQMPLAPGDFVARRVNWDSKAGNFASLAEELDLGLDTFILVDDNPKEVREVQAGVPQLLALLLPPRATEIPAFLAHVWAFDRARVTEEDRRRGEMYAQRAERARAARSSPSLEDFLASLALDVRIAPLEPAPVDRSPPRRDVRPAGRAGPRRAFLPQPGGFPGVARSRCPDRAPGARPGGPRGAAHPAHQPDERHLHPAHRGGTPAPAGGMPHGPRHRSLRQLWPYRRHPLSRGGKGAGGRHVPAQLPRAGPRRGTSHGGAPGRDRRGTRPRNRGDPVRGRAAQSPRAPLPGIARRGGRRRNLPPECRGRLQRAVPPFRGRGGADPLVRGRRPRRPARFIPAAERGRPARTRGSAPLQGRLRAHRERSPHARTNSPTHARRLPPPRRAARDRCPPHGAGARPGGPLGRPAQRGSRGHSRKLLRTRRPLAARRPTALARAPDLRSGSLPGGSLLW